MTNPHAHRLPELVAEAKASAAHVEHAWDKRAIDWPDLTSDSVVVEVGGYKGRWALQVAERYHPRLYVFEPQPWAYATCKEVLRDAATVLPYGLGAKSGIFTMGGWETDGCSFLKTGEHVGRLHEIGTAFAENGVDRVDLLLMNIEGYEYTLLPHMLEQGILPQRLMVQFHIFDDYGVGMGRLFDRLADAGYRVLWTYGVVLTAWERA
jgi:FkbM family methyltransferase